MSRDRFTVRDGVAFIRADQVRTGDRLDLQGDKFADPSGDGLHDHGTDFNGGDPIFTAFEFELALVESEPTRETPDCVLIQTSLGSYGFPPDHEIKIDRETNNA